MMQYRNANPHRSFLSLFQRDLQQGKLGTNELGDTVFFVDEGTICSDTISCYCHQAELLQC
jgi:hypothetical protein